MNKINYTIDDIKNLKEAFEKLFPEVKDIEIKKKRGLLIIKFSRTDIWILKKLLPKLTSTVVPFYELLFTQVAKQLSYKKVNNATYTSLYLDQISFVVNNAPELICQFLKETVERLPEAQKMTISELREETENILNKKMKETEKEKLHKLKIFDTTETGVIANLLSRIS